VRAVRSLLGSEGVDLEILVVDQSDGSETEEALMSLPHDSRLRYVRSEGRGKGAGMNEGLRLARSELVVCTDDDCEAPPEWVAGMAAILIQEPAVGAVFSNVVAGPHDPTAGYVPTVERSSDCLFRSVLATRSRLGIGAGMALRRGPVLSLGGLDEGFGPGARFPSCDDHDVAVRLLIRGWTVFHNSQIAIVHHGFRAYGGEGREHVRRDWLAIGAYIGKLGRSGHLTPVIVGAWIFWRHAIVPPFEDAFHARRAKGLVRITSFCEGFIAGLRTPVDPQTMKSKSVSAYSSVPLPPAPDA
jgi:glycosyltransferase involved in cell wall biosynthesis